MPSRRPGKAFWLVLAFAAILLPQSAQALHDQGYACYVCHTLKPGDVRPGSRAVLNLPGNVLPTIPTKPTATSLPLPGTGGYPISCDYCHRAAGDVPSLNMATKAYKHPVDLIQTGDVTTNPNEITCNDCHNGGTRDVVPTSLLARGSGYPDHLNLTAGYTHNLTSNPPHLTQPYWNAASLPGVTRANDTAFWTGVRNNTQNMLCWVCHDGAQASPYTNVTASANIRAEYTGVGNARGHQIRTTVSGAMQPGSALPCYDCHDSHGSVNAGLVLDNQSIYGAATSQLALTTYAGGRPRNDLRICAQCHDTGLAATAAGTRVEGLNPVDPYNSADTAIIHLSGGVADNMLLSSKNCLAANSGCHANPHNPVGESLGGQNCAVCHSSIYQAMDAGSSTGYHHVMLSDSAPAAGVYPTNPTPTTTPGDRTCLICHVDHNYFSKSLNPAFSRARNLRTDIALQPDNSIAGQIPVNTDYDNSLANGGICTSCHRNVQTKNNPGTNIKSDGVPGTALVGKPLFGGSAHNYATSSPFITSHFSTDNTLVPSSYFQANCAKCHNDTSTKNFQDNTSPMFAVHSSDNASAVNNMLAPLGYSPLTDNLSSNFCYRCHSRTADAVAGVKKPANGKDYYNNANMDNSAENIFGLFARTSRHPVNTADQAAGKVVDCLNCHNVHATRGATGGIAAQIDNTYAFAAYNMADNAYASKRSRAAYCLGCHDGAGPAATLSASAYVPVSVQITSPAMNKSLYGTRGHWSDNGALSSASIKSCDACHDKHGSTARALLGQYDPADGLNKINGIPVSATVTTADNTAICAACHNGAGADYPPTTVSAAAIATQEGYRDATGYFAAPGRVVRWPGKAAWDNASVSPHGASAKTAPAALGGRAVGECNTCHDPHGTPYNYNMLTDNMAAGNYRLCFDCHGLANSPAGTDNIAQYYPAASQGLGAAASATVNTGHNIKTAGGFLPQYTALPCYDCHVVHGSRNGNTQLKSDQRWANLGDTRSNAANSRTFCLGCHLAADDAATTGTVENLQRQTAGLNRLKLPTANPIVEHQSSGTQGCFVCHAGRNANDNSYGPHNPASGLCDLCHESQGARSSAAISFNGSHLKHSDNTTYRLACKQCHSWTRPTNPAVHKDNTSAVQYAQVAFDNEATGWSTIQYATPIIYGYRSMSLNPYGGGLLTPTYAGGTDNGTDLRQGSIRWRNGQCSTVWCHSNAAPVGNTNVFDTVNWGGTVTCGIDCHGNDGQGGRARIGDNASITRGSDTHYIHVGSMPCNNCHYGTVTGGNTSVNVYDNHVNGAKNVMFSPSIGGSYDNVNRTCSGTSCHGTPVPLPDWDNQATVSTCFSCHQGTEQPYKPQSANTLPNPVDIAQYGTRGHGLASGNYPATLNPAGSFDNAANDCYYCHSENALHAPATDNVNDPYRLNGGGQKPGSAVGNWADNTNGLCLKCHGSTSERAGVTVGLATTAYNDNNHDMAHAKTLIGVWSFTPKCVDCHDPHGDANNAMIRSGINAPTSATDNNPTTGAGSSSKGTPLRTTNISTVVFTDNTGYAANSYAAPGAATYGICEVCHNQTTAYSRTADSTPAHTATGNCMACHLHGTGFKGMGGPDVGQYFDRRIQAPSATNYADNSSHPMRGLTEGSSSLVFGAGSTNCLGCHYASGPSRTSDECYKCHFENTSGANAALGSQHMDKQIQLATVSGNNLPSSAFTIATIADYDAWCLQCHDTGATTSLGGVTASSGNKTIIPSAAFANGRHRANNVGCIYCHQPHGRSNAKLVRENGWNRSQAGVTPKMFSVFPNDNLNTAFPPLRAQTVNYRARLYWADNVANPYLAEADDDQAYCNTMCHAGRFSATYVKDKIVKRDATSGNYVVNGAPMYRKVYLVNGVEYTIDNTLETQHQHINGEIVSTDNMVAAYGTLAGVTGPSYYQYPLTTSSLPSAYSPATSDLPFLPDYADGVRDFTNAYNNLGQRIVYRFTCSTCHNPHGNTFANAPGDDGFPDLRLLRANPSTLCVRCHK